MLFWTVVLELIALVAGLLGFSGIYMAASGIARTLFSIFLVLFILTQVATGISRWRACRKGDRTMSHAL